MTAIHSVMLAVAVLGADLAVESDQENQTRCRASVASISNKSDRVTAYLACRDAYTKRAREAGLAAYARQREEAAAREAEAKAAEAAVQAKREADAKEREARYQAERARQDAEAAARKEEEARAAAEEARAEAALEKKCGKDYMRVEVGMAFKRVRECSGPFTLVGQVNRKDGVASTYSAEGGSVVVMRGKVVAWRRSY